MRSFFDLSFQDIESVLAGLDPRPFRFDQILRWVYRMGVDNFEEMTDMPIELRRSLSHIFDLNPIEILSRHCADDGTDKFLFILHDGELIESVLIPEDKHFTLCVSSQAGCTMSCAFCETGKSGSARNLTVGEILVQIVMACRYLGNRLRLRNLVFMGMGEPLRNLDALLPALGVIVDERAFGFSPRRITVSTCGWVPGMERLAAEGLDVNLAVSLNATEDRTRSKIMPVNRDYPIGELMEAVRRYPLKSRKRITIEYVLMDGINDSTDDAVRLAGLLDGIPSKVNLIACNANSSALKSPPPERVRNFHETLLKNGVMATVRKSKGEEILAACGQLKASTCEIKHAY
jgi:23S rRNA (adenine2503-C2)-methyltransferase